MCVNIELRKLTRHRKEQNAERETGQDRYKYTYERGNTIVGYGQALSNNKHRAIKIPGPTEERGKRQVREGSERMVSSQATGLDI